jgi:hypothetical protein
MPPSYEPQPPTQRENLPFVWDDKMPSVDLFEDSLQQRFLAKNEFKIDEITPAATLH